MRPNYPYLLSHFTAVPPTPPERIILRELIDHEYTNNERLIDQLYGDREDGGPLCAVRCIDQYLFHLRRKLIPGWSIRRHYRREIYLEEN